jgi:hypothetical protein
MYRRIEKGRIGLAAVCFFVVAVALGAPTAFAQEKAEHRSLVPENGTRYTGAVDLIMAGKPQLKNAREILAIAKKTKFNEAGGYESKYNGGSVAYVPPEATHDALRKALTEGLLLYKFTIKGASPKNINLPQGTYYFYMQFIDGRWVGFAVDEEGISRCFTFGLIAREVYTEHPGREHVPGSYIAMHQIASADDLAKLGDIQAADADWADVQIGWQPFGAGCWKQIVCVPGT